MHTKRIVVSLVMLVTAFLTSTSAALSQEQKSIRFATPNDPFVSAVNDMLVANFNKLHPDVKVNIEYVPGAELPTTFASQAAAKNVADVVFLAAFYVVPFAKGGIVMDMEPLAKADKTFDLSDIYPNMLDLSRVNGKGLYMIPSSFDVVTMYYNKTMFDKAKVKYPTDKWTWDDYTTACVAIRKATGDYCFAGGMNKDPFWWAWYVPFIKGYGGDVMSADGQKVLLNTP